MHEEPVHYDIVFQRDKKKFHLIGSHKPKEHDVVGEFNFHKDIARLHAELKELNKHQI